MVNLGDKKNVFGTIKTGQRRESSHLREVVNLQKLQIVFIERVDIWHHINCQLREVVNLRGWSTLEVLLYNDLDYDEVSLSLSLSLLSSSPIHQYLTII